MGTPENGIAALSPEPLGVYPDSPELHDHISIEDDSDSTSSDCAEVVESALEHFSTILQKAQQLTVQAQRDRATAEKQPREGTGKSRTTIYRQK